MTSNNSLSQPHQTHDSTAGPDLSTPSLPAPMFDGGNTASSEGNITTTLQKASVQSKKASSKIAAKTASMFKKTRAIFQQTKKASSTHKDVAPPSSLSASVSDAKDDIFRSPVPAVAEVSSTQDDLQAAVGHDAVTTTLPLPVGEFPFLRLPGELRNMVYKHALVTDGKVNITREHGIPEPALLSTCKKIRKEAIGIFYHDNTFQLTARSHHPAVNLMWTRKVRSLRRQGGSIPRFPSTQHVGKRNWHNLKGMLREMHAGNIRFSWMLEPHTRGSTDRLEYSRFLPFLESMVEAMYYWSWQRAEGVIDTLRPCLIVLHTDWASDQIIQD